MTNITVAAKSVNAMATAVKASSLIDPKTGAQPLVFEGPGIRVEVDLRNFPFVERGDACNLCLSVVRIREEAPEITRPPGLLNGAG